jgi:hypothetical protein
MENRRDAGVDATRFPGSWQASSQTGAGRTKPMQRAGIHAAEPEAGVQPGCDGVMTRPAIADDV